MTKIISDGNLQPNGNGQLPNNGGDGITSDNKEQVVEQYGGNEQLPNYVVSKECSITQHCTNFLNWAKWME